MMETETVDVITPEGEAYLVKQKLAEDGHDLPELAATMEEADARASASSYLHALRNVERDVDANDAEFSVLQDFNRRRHVARQETLLRQVQYLRDSVRTLFGFMTVTGKKKSLNRGGGRVGTRSRPDGLVVKDEDKVVAWARHYGESQIVRIKESVDRKALRTFVEGYDPVIEAESGNDVPLPPGVSLESRPDEFFATPATD